MRERVPSVQRLGLGAVRGYKLQWHKRSIDGSGKCNVSPVSDEGSTVHGVLYLFPEQEKLGLDAVEGLGQGYEKVNVRVETSSGLRDAFTYVAASSHVHDALQPFSWYRDLVVDGARRAGLPVDYVQALEGVSAREDRDKDRDARNRKAIPCETS